MNFREYFGYFCIKPMSKERQDYKSHIVIVIDYCTPLLYWSTPYPPQNDYLEITFQNIVDKVCRTVLSPNFTECNELCLWKFAFTLSNCKQTIYAGFHNSNKLSSFVIFFFLCVFDGFKIFRKTVCQLMTAWFTFSFEIHYNQYHCQRLRVIFI